MQELLNDQANRIETICTAQGLDLRVVGGTLGPRLTVFHALKPASVKLSAILRMDDEIALGLGVPACRIGRSGHHLTIEIPRRDPTTVHLMRLIQRAPTRPGAIVVGVDEEDVPLLLSLNSPNVGHVLIAGTTGSGKTALARAMIAGLALTHAVFELGLVLIDPKRRGYVPFAGLPHLVHPVIHEPEEAAGALAWTVEELERRDREGVSTPRLVVFIDELADLIQTAGEAEASLTRLVQRGREAGLHVVACTQKPTTAVIGSLVKANFPARIVGRVTDTNDAYVAAGISGTGAERLLGRGDFLVITSDVTRMQAAYISEPEIRDLVTRLRGGRSLDPATEPLDEPGRDLGTGAAQAGTGLSRSDRPVDAGAGSPAWGRVLDFVERHREHRNGQHESDRRGGHNKKEPTEEMIAFALKQLAEHGEVSQRAVRRFHRETYHTDCNPRRAQAAIETALERRNGKDEGVSGG